MAANTYTALKSTTVTGSPVSSVTLDLTGISGYKDLVIISEARTSSGAGGWLQFNSDTGANYSFTIMFGETPSTIGSYRQSSQNAARYTYAAGIGTTDGNKTISKIQIQNFANTSTYKNFLVRSDRASNGLDAIVGLWKSTNAITSVTMYPLSDTFSVGSTFTLYGIASADTAAKATGGTIFQDSNYFYHVFTANGTFTPASSLSADILVVAGGGGGGSGGGGGGGAGGLLAYSSQSLSATGYTCTVGGGGTNGTSNAKGSTGSNSSFGGLTASVGGGGGAGYAGSGNNATSGGSGGGGAGATSGGASASGAAGTSGQGYAGGTGSSDGGAGGGGGAGSIGGNGTNGGSGVGGAGGAGVNTYSSWLTTTGVGVSGYIAGGGGGGGYAGTGTGGSGGGANGGTVAAATTAGLINSGSGGGGGGAGSSWAGTPGGSGVIIVRYAK